MIACRYGLGIGLWAAIMAQGRRPRIIMGVRRSILRPYHYKPTIKLFINWLLDLSLIPRFYQAIIRFTRPLWILLGRFGLAIMGSASHVIKHRHECP